MDHFEEANIGLNHLSYLEPMLQRLCGSDSPYPLMVLTNVLKNENRVHTDGYHTLKPLTDLIDAIPPESVTAWRFNVFANHMMENKENFNKYVGTARKILTDWAENHNKLAPLLANPVPGAGHDIGPASHFSPILSNMAKCGLAALDFLEGKSKNKAESSCQNTISQGSQLWKKTRIDIGNGIKILLSRPNPF